MSGLFTESRSLLIWAAIALLILVLAVPLLESLVPSETLARYRLPVFLHRTRKPLRAVLAVIAARILLAGLNLASSWTGAIDHGLTIAMIVALVWLIASATLVLEDLTLSRLEESYTGEAVRARQAKTQITLLRRLIVAFVITLGSAAILTTFPAMNVFGRGILASAGLISIIAGLAAQTTLTNVFAGIQLALSNALRVDDVVALEDESGVVADITLTYVVISLWDERRLILPCSYFVSHPFENWTRNRDHIGGDLFLDVDWTAPVAAMREELARVLDATPLWDRRWSNLVVADARDGHIRIRIDLSAADARSLFRLRNHVREAMVTFLSEGGAGGLPRLRTERLEPGSVVYPERRARRIRSTARVS